MRTSKHLGCLPWGCKTVLKASTPRANCGLFVIHSSVFFSFIFCHIDPVSWSCLRKLVKWWFPIVFVHAMHLKFILDNACEWFNLKCFAVGTSARMFKCSHFEEFYPDHDILLSCALISGTHEGRKLSMCVWPIWQVLDCDSDTGRFQCLLGCIAYWWVA